MAVLALTCKVHCSAMFRGIGFQLPALSFSLDWETFRALTAIGDLAAVASFDPGHFMESSLVLTALNFLISL